MKKACHLLHGPHLGILHCWFCNRKRANKSHLSEPSSCPQKKGKKERGGKEGGRESGRRGPESRLSNSQTGVSQGQQKQYAEVMKTPSKTRLTREGRAVIPLRRGPPLGVCWKFATSATDEHNEVRWHWVSSGHLPPLSWGSPLALTLLRAALERKPSGTGTRGQKHPC